MVEQDKPFKTIEVVDASTGEACKVACMSCIRGHRTTSCGIPVCRSKVFWTVKRPGRPSNSCTCRYGGTGRCKCAMVKTACPHKAKKGEKRSGECRCDEQGRYCCLIIREQWIELLALGRPVVNFFPSREALEARNPPLGPAMMPNVYPSPSHGTFLLAPPTTPIGTTTTDGQFMPNGLVPRFGPMAVGTPFSGTHSPPDLLSWQTTPTGMPASPYSHLQVNMNEHEQGSFNHGFIPPSVQPDTPASFVSLADMTNTTTSPQMSQFDTVLRPANVATQHSTLSPFDFNKMTADYLHYQLPNAICQKCGLEGCTCKHCPPVMQDSSTGSWAQMCGRKHARTSAAACATPVISPKRPHIGSDHETVPINNYTSGNAFDQSTANTSESGPSTFGNLTFHNDIDDDMIFTELEISMETTRPMQLMQPMQSMQSMELSDLLMSNLDEPPTGHSCCGG